MKQDVLNQTQHLLKTNNFFKTLQLGIFWKFMAKSSVCQQKVNKTLDPPISEIILLLSYRMNRGVTSLYATREWIQTGYLLGFMR